MGQKRMDLGVTVYTRRNTEGDLRFYCRSTVSDYLIESVYREHPDEDFYSRTITVFSNYGKVMSVRSGYVELGEFTKQNVIDSIQDYMMSNIPDDPRIGRKNMHEYSD